jgi:hypothetical protein
MVLMNCDEIVTLVIPKTRMKTKRFYLRLFVSLLSSGALFAQPASYAEGGMMKINLKSKGDYLSNSVPGFSIAISGLEVSLYAGQFRQKEYPDSAQLGVNGGLWNIGYIWRSKPRENLKRFHYTIGAGVGGYGIGESNGFDLNIHPGVQVNLTRSLSITGSFYAGYNIFGKMRREGGLLYENDLYKSTYGLFFLPNITLRLNTNPLMVMGKSFNRKTYWGGGMVHEETTSREGDYIVTRRSSYYLPAGEYITDAIITSTNYVNIFPKMLVGTRKNDKGLSLAYGGGMALRLGILCMDLEYLTGKIGYHDISYQHYGNNLDYWKMKRFSAGVGINWFNIPFPFKGPSIVRVILGARFGYINLQNAGPGPNYLPYGTDPALVNKKGKCLSPYWGVEFGTLGLQFEIINNKAVSLGTGMLMSATYLIPIPIKGAN